MSVDSIKTGNSRVENTVSPEGEQEHGDVSLENLHAQLDQLNEGNKDLYGQVSTGIESAISRIVERLKDPSTPSIDKKELGRQRQQWSQKLQEIAARYPEFSHQEDIRDAKLAELIDSLIDSVPDESDRSRLKDVFATIPRPVQEKYATLLKGRISNKNEVAITTGVRDLLFELERIKSIQIQGLETVDYSLAIAKPVAYEGYAKNTRFEDGALPTERLESPIDLDVPISRNGKPYVYEVKSYPRMKYGGEVNHRNQLLKYQEAIEQGVVDGATIEIKGRLDPEFLHWAFGSKIGEEGAVPDVEVLYTFDLPSGSEYRFVLKRSSKGEGLNFHNADKEYTAEDKKVVAGIQKALFDRSLPRILTGNGSEVADPMEITSLDEFKKYEKERNGGVYGELLSKREIINVENRRSAYSESANREYVETNLREYQDYLEHNPQIAKAKKGYLIDSEEAMVSVVDEAMERIEKIRSFELSRQAQEEANPVQREGYSGKPEGVALDIEHILMDSILEVNKRQGQTGRSYENLSRFKSLEDLPNYLSSQDRSYIEVATFDPITNQTDRNTDVTEAFIVKREAEILKDNIRRAKDYIEEEETTFASLLNQDNWSEEDELKLKIGKSLQRRAEFNMPAIRRIEQRLDALRGTKTESIRAEKDNGRKKELATEFDEKIKDEMLNLSEHYRQILSDNIWNKTARRMLKPVRKNIIKFIYTVSADDKILVDEEVVRGDASGRAAHSELAQGQNVYGAGELAFTKTDGRWELTEINNGSGHYRPPYSVLPHVKNVITGKGIDTGKAVLEETLLRGTPIQDIGFLE